jgi:hypothetical protein
MYVGPIATSKRCDGRKTRLRASSFNDARVGRGGQPLRKTQLRNGRLFFPNAMGTMRDGALGIERIKRVGGRKGGISCRIRVTLEFVSGVGRWTGVRWDGDWHLAKEGLGLSDSQAPTAGPLGLEGLTGIDGNTRRECHRGEREERDENRRKRVVKMFVKKMEEGKNRLGSGGERTAKACPFDDFLAGLAEGQSQTGCPRKAKDPGKKAGSLLPS